MTDIERFLQKIIIDDNDHWIWQASKTGTHGQYGGFYFEAKLQQSHRAIWKMLVGPIPYGLTINHKCRITLCQNIDHMELVTRGENSNLGNGPTGLNSRKTECSHGHGPYDYISPKGFRSCKTCAKIKIWAYRRKMTFTEGLKKYNPTPYERSDGCKIEGCALKHKARGYCVNHYALFMKYRAKNF